MKSVVILTAGFGEGHNAAARNLRDEFAKLDPPVEVEMVDIFDRAYGVLNRSVAQGYLLVINRAPWVWTQVFNWLDRSTAVPSHIGVFARAAKELRAVLERTKPGVVFSTYPGYAHLLDHLYGRGGERPFVQVTIVTDSITINRVWHSGSSDYYAVPNAETAEVMERQGVDRGMLRVTGFPVPGVFEKLREPKVVPTGEGRWRVLFMVNSGKTIAPEVAKRLVEVPGIELTVTVGRDDALQRRIEEALGEAAARVKFFGWTDQISRLMAEAHIVVSKAGGATVQECLAARSPMVVSQIVPGQEEGNARLITEAGAGCVAVTPTGIAAAVRRATADGGKVWRDWYAGTEGLSRPEAARRMAERTVAMLGAGGSGDGERADFSGFEG